MCTVVFTPKGGRCYFPSLRDEYPLRPNASAPEIYLSGNTAVLSPIDNLAGGTWVGAAEWGNVIILLNGGFKNHEPKKIT